MIRVSDTGTGMNSETQTKIFDPFYTTKEIGKGTGLGLSVVFGIIKNHNGFLNVSSVQGEGSIFEIFLPLVSSKPHSIKEFSNESLSDFKKVGGTILFAEDEKLLREITSEVLESAGYTVILAKNGKDAVELFRKNRDEVDLLLFDVMMPVMGGVKAYKKIHTIKSDIPVLFASGYSSESIDSKLMPSDAFDIIWKPFEREELLDKIFKLT